MSTAHYALCIQGYSLLPAGTQAEIENSYATTLRLEDVLDHLIAADRGEVKLDLQRAIDVLTEIHELKDERLEGLLEREDSRGGAGDRESTAAGTGSLPQGVVSSDGEDRGPDGDSYFPRLSLGIFTQKIL